VPRIFPTVVIAVACLLAGCAGSKDYTSIKEKRELFESFFGFPPPETVLDIAGRRVWIGDTLSDWIRFPCDTKLFERIVATTHVPHFEKAQMDESWKYDLPDLDTANPNAPTWWPTKPRETIRVLYYERRPYSENQSQSDKLYFWRDAETGVTFAHYVSWR
jgi:hypothetical protein